MPLHNNLLIIIDILTETLSSLRLNNHQSNTFIIKLYLFLSQDLAILAATLSILLQFFRKDILRDGKTKSLLSKHWSKIIICFLYLMITIMIQIIMVVTSDYIDHNTDSSIVSNIEIFFICIKLIQRLMAIVYYFALHKNIKLV